jgi:hypothetical protein
MTRYDCPQCGNGKLKFIRAHGRWECNGLMDPPSTIQPLQACDFSCEKLPSVIQTPKDMSKKKPKERYDQVYTPRRQLTDAVALLAQVDPDSLTLTARQRVKWRRDRDALLAEVPGLVRPLSKQTRRAAQPASKPFAW